MDKYIIVGTLVGCALAMAFLFCKVIFLPANALCASVFIGIMCVCLFAEAFFIWEAWDEDD